MEHHHTFADQHAVENPRDTHSALEPQLELSFAKGLGVRLPKIWPQHNHSPGQHYVASGKRVGQRQYLVLNLLAVVTDRVVHDSNYNKCVISGVGARCALLNGYFGIDQIDRAVCLLLFCKT